MSEEQKSVTATVKWYKNDKGFGFVRFADGSGEAFLHSRVLVGVDAGTLTEGTVLVCDIAETPKGLQVAAIHAVTPAAPAASKPRRSRSPKASEPQQRLPVSAREDRPQGSGPSIPSTTTGEMTVGTVRWYNLISQSGLIDPWDDETGGGVYFDRAVLRQSGSGLELLADGEDVRFIAVSGDDGPYAVWVEPA
ncbi:cold-shock protein [Azospirillum canadense]|uniref:cold-shock protein n=1 Tax=Azospirillum canadense TaxID=403962 RepID=UPI0022262446|nr:cold shock domain-containing protein [Azospirillum canadense]MCW2240656.1 CspA family cold shock protein [Azospirillum canadense]